MDIKKLKKQVHSANSFLAVIYGYLQLIESDISKRKDSENKKDILWVSKSIKACIELRNLILEIESELK